jgi:hypothetical protein
MIDNYYEKYLKYKNKYILFKKNLIGGGKASAKNIFINNFLKSKTIIPNLINDKVQKKLIDFPEELLIEPFTEKKLESLFEIIYNKLLEIIIDPKDLDKQIDFIIKSYLNNTFGIPSSFENLGRFIASFNNYNILQNNRHRFTETFKLIELSKLNGLSGLSENYKVSLETYLDLPEVQSELDKIIATKTEKNEGKMKPFIETSNILIYKPETEAQAKCYGRKTKWCTAADHHNMFTTYFNKGPLYILISQKNPQIKFQIHMETNSFMNDKDEGVSIINILTSFNYDMELMQFLVSLFVKPKDDSFILTFNYRLNEILKISPEFNDVFNKYINRLKDKTLNITIDKFDNLNIFDNLNNIVSLTFNEEFNEPIGTSLSKLTNLEKLVFNNNFNEPLETSLSNLTNLKELTFGSRFNKQLGTSLSNLTKLEKMVFNNDFNEPLRTSLDNLINLKELTFGSKFNKQLGTSLSKLIKLEKLVFGNNFDQPLETSLSNLINLKELIFGHEFNNDWNPLEPSLANLKNLENLEFGTNFNQSLGTSLENLKKLKQLIFGEEFNKPLETSLSYLTNLEELTFGKQFSKPLETSLSNLTNLKKLTFGSTFNKPLGTSLSNLINLKELTFNYSFDQILGTSLSNLRNLEILVFGFFFNNNGQPLGTSFENLINLKELKFRDYFKQQFGTSLTNLINLKKLELNSNYRHDIPENLLPIRIFKDN